MEREKVQQQRREDEEGRDRYSKNHLKDLSKALNALVYVFASFAVKKLIRSYLDLTPRPFERRWKSGERRKRDRRRKKGSMTIYQ
jgi:hypothetical protein